MNMPTYFEKRQLVTPGDLIAEGDYVAGENTYLEKGKVYASRVGVVDYDNKRASVVALKAFYIPRTGDVVIGTIVEVGFNGWTVDINAPYQAILRASEVLGRPFKPQQDDLPQVLESGRTGTRKNNERRNHANHAHKDTKDHRQKRLNDIDDKTGNRMPHHTWTQRPNPHHG